MESIISITHSINNPMTSTRWFTHDELEQSFVFCMWNKTEGLATSVGHVSILTNNNYLSVHPLEELKSITDVVFNTQTDDERIYNRPPDNYIIVETYNLIYLDRCIEEIKSNRNIKWGVRTNNSYEININTLGYCCAQGFINYMIIIIGLIKWYICICYINTEPINILYDNMYYSYTTHDGYNIYSREVINCTESCFIALTKSGIIDGYFERERLRTPFTTSLSLTSRHLLLLPFITGLCYGKPLVDVLRYKILLELPFAVYLYISKPKHPHNNETIIGQICHTSIEYLLVATYIIYFSNFININNDQAKYTVNMIILIVIYWISDIIGNLVHYIISLLTGKGSILLPTTLFNIVSKSAKRKTIYCHINPLRHVVPDMLSPIRGTIRDYSLDAASKYRSLANLQSLLISISILVISLDSTNYTSYITRTIYGILSCISASLISIAIKLSDNYREAIYSSLQKNFITIKKIKKDGEISEEYKNKLNIRDDNNLEHYLDSTSAVDEIYILNMVNITCFISYIITYYIYNNDNNIIITSAIALGIYFIFNITMIYPIIFYLITMIYGFITKLNCNTYPYTLLNTYMSYPYIWIWKYIITTNN